MRIHTSVALLCAIGLLTACGTSPSEKQKIADARYTEEKTKTLKEYKECVEKARGDTQKLTTCEALLKAVEAMEPPAQPATK